MSHTRKTKHAPAPGPCTYCGQRFEQLTWDHVLPQSYYPNGTQRAAKDQFVVPACGGCQVKLSRVEELMRQVLICAVDINEPSARGLVEDAMRAFRPWHAHDEDDRAIRQRRRDTFLRETLRVKTFEERVPGVEVGVD